MTRNAINGWGGAVTEVPEKTRRRSSIAPTPMAPTSSGGGLFLLTVTAALQAGSDGPRSDVPDGAKTSKDVKNVMKASALRAKNRAADRLAKVRPCEDRV